MLTMAQTQKVARKTTKKQAGWHRNAPNARIMHLNIVPVGSTLPQQTVL